MCRSPVAGPTRSPICALAIPAMPSMGERIPVNARFNCACSTAALAEATVGVGAGANLLVGGSEKTFTLQPLSVQAQSGLNVAAGVTSFQLEAAR